jgi:hypothetical protein
MSYLKILILCLSFTFLSTSYSLAQNSNAPFNLDNGLPESSLNNDGTVVSPTEASKEAIKRFVYKNSILYGEVLDCSADEASYIGQCTNIVLHNWHTITGMQNVNDSNFSNEISNLWDSNSQEAQKETSASNFNCKDILDQDFNSSMWKVCKRPSNSDNTTPEIKIQ